MLCNACHKNESKPDRKLCESCLAKLAVTGTARRLRLIAAGICYTCGKEPVVNGSKRCVACNAKDAQRRSLIVAQRRIDHLCTQCGQPLDTPSSMHLCAKCLAPRSADQRRRRNFRKEAGICVDCDQPICSKSKQYCEKHWGIYNAKNRESYFDGLRKPALERDGYACKICGLAPTRMDVHHLDLDREHNELENLISLCSQCHRSITHLLRCADPQKLIEFVKVHYLGT